MGGNFVAAGAACACMGLVILIVGIILIATAQSDEIKMWYGVNLCPCADCETDPCVASKCAPTDPLHQAGGSVWQGMYVPQDSQCRVNPPLTKADGSSQSFELEQQLFSMDGLEYHPIIYRTDGAARMQFRVTEGDETLMGGEVQAKSEGELEVVPQTEEDVQPTDVAEDTASKSSSRSLMKGGRSAGGPARTRSGAAGRYGNGAKSYKTSYGRTTCCVTGGTVIFVNRPGPYTRRGYYDTDGDGDAAQATDCTSSSNGCAYELSQDMTRDELDQFSLVPTRDMDWPLKLHVDFVQTTSYIKNRAPEIYVSFWTEDPDNAKVASYVLLPLGSVMIFLPLVAVLFA